MLLPALVAGGLLLVSSASARPAADTQVAAGSLMMTSEAGDYVGQGQSYSYATPTDLFLAGTDVGGTGVRIREIRPNFSNYWELDFSAPDGQQLIPGLYSNV